MSVEISSGPPLELEPTPRTENDVELLNSSIDHEVKPCIAPCGSQDATEPPESLAGMGAGHVAIDDSSPKFESIASNSPITDEKRPRDQPLRIKKRRGKIFEIDYLSRWLGRIPWITRPMLKLGYRRIEWTCVSPVFLCCGS